MVVYYPGTGIQQKTRRNDLTGLADSNCPFCLGFGERMEVHWLKDHDHHGATLVRCECTAGGIHSFEPKEGRQLPATMMIDDTVTLVPDPDRKKTYAAFKKLVNTLTDVTVYPTTGRHRYVTTRAIEAGGVLVPSDYRGPIHAEAHVTYSQQARTPIANPTPAVESSDRRALDG